MADRRTELSSWSVELSKWIGQKIAVLCTHHNYHGVLAGIGDNSIDLTDAHVVARSGPCDGKPVTETPIKGNVAIKIEAIEIIYQPRFDDAH